MTKPIGFDMTNMTLIAFAGIVIKVFLGGNYSDDGTSGPAGAAMWGYGLVAIAVLVTNVCNCLVLHKINGKNTKLASIRVCKRLIMKSLIPPMLLLGV